MRRIAALAAALLLAAGSPVQRGDLIIPGSFDGDDWSSPAFALAQAERVIQLARATRTITAGGMDRPSDLRVSLLVLDLGPSTDVSGRQALHLAMFNDIEEHGIAWALEPIAEVWEFHGAERSSAGIYVIDATIPAYETGSEGCFFQRVKLTVDARDLSVAVRNAAGLAEFDARRYQGEIGVEMERTACVN